MSLKDKASMIDLSNLSTISSPRAASSKTAIGMHADALFRDEQLSKENTSLKGQLSEKETELKVFEGADPVRLLDPTKVLPSKWANRHEDSFSTDEFSLIKADIAHSRENVQPIKVRPIAGTDTYELVYGHRRHRACLDLGIPVKAVIEQIDDRKLFVQMDRENRHRADLSAYEQGVFYGNALTEGMFSSLRALCEATGANLGNTSQAVRLARMPEEILAAFPSKLLIQFKWILPLTQRYEVAPEHMLKIAKEITSAKTALNPLSAKDIFSALTTPPDEDGASIPVKRALSIKGKEFARVTENKGKYKIEFLEPLPKSQMKLLEDFVLQLRAVE